MQVSESTHKSIILFNDVIIGGFNEYTQSMFLTHNEPNTTIAEFANTVDPDETAHNEPSHLDLQCLPSSL